MALDDLLCEEEEQGAEVGAARGASWGETAREGLGDARDFVSRICNGEDASAREGRRNSRAPLLRGVLHPNARSHESPTAFFVVPRRVPDLAFGNKHVVRGSVDCSAVLLFRSADVSAAGARRNVGRSGGNRDGFSKSMYPS